MKCKLLILVVVLLVVMSLAIGCDDNLNGTPTPSTAVTPTTQTATDTPDATKTPLETPVTPTTGETPITPETPTPTMPETPTPTQTTLPTPTVPATPTPTPTPTEAPLHTLTPQPTPTPATSALPTPTIKDDAVLSGKYVYGNRDSYSIEFVFSGNKVTNTKYSFGEMSDTMTGTFTLSDDKKTLTTIFPDSESAADGGVIEEAVPIEIYDDRIVYSKLNFKKVSE